MTKLDLRRVREPKSVDEKHLFLIPNQIKTLRFDAARKLKQAEQQRKGKG